jgi:hypothetical protein
MKGLAIGASMAVLAWASLASPSLAGSDDVYFWCWKQAEYVRPALDPKGGKEAWVANCVADHTPDRTYKPRRRSKKQY